MGALQLRRVLGILHVAGMTNVELTLVSRFSA